MHTITLSPVGDTLPCRSDETVLAAILGSGASVVFGCRGGGCGACRMRLASGRVEHGCSSTAVLPDQDRAAGWFLSCQARALGDLTIELTAANKYRVLTWLRRLRRDET